MRQLRSLSGPAEFRSDVLEDADEHVGVVVHTQLVRGRETVCGTVVSFNSDASVWQRALSKPFVHSEAFLFLLNHATVTNYLG